MPVVFLMGPTASGKTALAIDLVQHYPFEIISVDSALIYKEMDIGTAKPTAEELRIAPHHLIDFLDPAETYSVAQFRHDALRLIGQIHKKNKIPLLVGGTMLYHRALLYGLSTLPSADAGLRKKLDQQLRESGSQQLHQVLQKIDPQAAKRIHPNDPQRIQRALEVYYQSGKNLSYWQQHSAQQKLTSPFHKIIIVPDSRQWLRERIALRFMQMLESGFIDEVRGLMQRGDLSLQHASMRCVGYRQIWEYLQGNHDYETMVDKAITATRQFAKRQITWLRKELHDSLKLSSEQLPDSHWLIQQLQLT